MPHTSVVSAGTLEDSEARGFCSNRFSADLVPAGRAETSGFFAFRDRQGALADGLHGLNPRNTTGVRFTLHDRGGLSERDRRKLGSSGDSSAQPIESLPLGALGGVLMVAHGSTRLNARFRNGLHSESVRWGTFKASLGEGRSSGITLARTMEKR